jgi:2-succinyl-6-hydroxy-2,4-cyclohexadiene-1-carboxylate synthase
MNIRGLKYYVAVIGEGEPLLFLHGFTGASKNWLPFSQIIKGFQVILIDIIGHGKTDSPIDAKRYSMEEAVLDLHEILLNLQLEKINILGYSMGGRLALSFAVTYPEKVMKLLLESASPGLASEQDRKSRRASDQKLAEDINNEGIPAFVKKWEEIPLFATQKKLSNEIRTSIRQQRLQNNSIGLSNSLIGMGTGSMASLWDKLELIKEVPILLICGKDDLKFCAIAKKMQETLQHATIIEVPNAGHAIHVEKPEIFGKIIFEFLVE